MDLSKRTALIILITILLFSSLLVTVFFDPKEILSNAPMYNDDFSMHYAQCITTKHFISTWGQMWGYDPFFLAGYPKGVLHPDIIAWELFYYVTSPALGSGLSFKLYMLIFLVMYPLCIYCAARNFNLSRTVSLTASFLSILLFHLTLAVDFVFWGVVSYVIVCFFSVYVFSAFYRLFERFTWAMYLWVALISSLLFLMHVLALIHLVAPLFLLYILSARKMTGLQNAAVLFIPFIMAGINSFWLSLIFEFYGYKTAQPENYEFTLQIKNVFEAIKVYVEQRRSINSTTPLLNNTFFDIIMFGSSGLYCL